MINHFLSFRGLARRCLIPTVINGVEFFKNMPIMIDILGVHYNPEVWGPVDPHKFYPLRLALGNFLGCEF